MNGPTLSWIDLAMAGLLLLSVVVGLMRGVVFELLSLAGWFVAWFGGNWLEPWLAPHLPVGLPGSALNRGVAFACGFIAILVVWGLAARLVSMLVKATPLRPVDRLLGAVFGAVRGLVVLLVAATLVAWTPAARSPVWQRSLGAVWLDALLHRLLPMVPAEAGPPPVRPIDEARGENDVGGDGVVNGDGPMAMTNRS